MSSTVQEDCWKTVSETAKISIAKIKGAKVLVIYFSLSSYPPWLCLQNRLPSEFGMLTAAYSPKSDKFAGRRVNSESSQLFHIEFSAGWFSAKKRAPQLECPPYWTNMASCDFHMLPKPKMSLKGPHIETQNNVTGLLKGIQEYDFWEC